MTTSPTLREISPSVGYNPLRKYRGAKGTEVAILIIFTVGIVALILWASR